MVHFLCLILLNIPAVRRRFQKKKRKCEKEVTVHT